MKTYRIFLITFVLGLSASCASIQSDELASTVAADLEIQATIKEYNHTDNVEVSAVMKTRESAVNIEFTRGESLTVQSDAATGLSETVTLSNTELLNLEQDYEGTVDKTVAEGQYHLTYTDQDGLETTADIDTGSVPDITAPAADTLLTGDTVTVTWNVDTTDTTGSYFVLLQTESGARSCSSYDLEDVENTGSYAFEFNTCCSGGTGTLDLMRVEYTVSAAGFGETDIEMQNISRVNITCPGSGAALVTDPSKAASHTCKEGEVSYQIVNDVRQDFCQ